MEKVRGDVAAITQQADAMQRERELAARRIWFLKYTIAGRAAQDLTNLHEIKRRVLAHKSSEASALEPGWDVVN